MTSAVTYQFYTQNSQRLLDAIAARPQTTRETEYYLAAITEIDSVEAFIADDRAFNYVMRAYGLEEMAYAKAFIRKVLEEGIDDPDALANRLSDNRYRELATDFNFARHGEVTTTFGRTQQGTVDRYMQNRFEVEAGQASEGARLALYFDRRADTISTAYDILADRALFETVRVAFGMPLEMALLPIDKQAELITARLDIADLEDPEKRADFLERFTVQWDLQNPDTTARPAVLPIGGTIQTLSVDLLAAIQTIRIGN